MTLDAAWSDGSRGNEDGCGVRGLSSWGSTAAPPPRPRWLRVARPAGRAVSTRTKLRQVENQRDQLAETVTALQQAQVGEVGDLRDRLERQGGRFVTIDGTEVTCGCFIVFASRTARRSLREISKKLRSSL